MSTAAPHLLLALPQQHQLLLHFTHMAGCLGNLGSLQVTLGEELLDVLLFLLQGLLKGRGARDLPRVPRGRLCQLQGGKLKIKNLLFSYTCNILSVMCRTASGRVDNTDTSNFFLFEQTLSSITRLMYKDSCE